METRRQNVDPLAITQRNTSLNGGGESSEPIPIDLIIEILSRLPAKSIGRCRCVSRLWSSILGRPDFTELFLTRSSARPQLLFACQKYSELFFFSTPQPQNPDEKSSPLAASYLMKIPFDFFFERFSPTNGLVYLRDELSLKGKINPELVSVIYNPSTGQSLPLPKMITKRRVGLKSYLGYDPIGKQFKVLSMTSSSFGLYYGVCEEHQVLTLGAKSPSWRMIECCIPHCPMYSEICIDGVLYYRASVNGSTEVTMLVCFDFRSEEFRFMEVMENFSRAVDVSATLVNYNGKLGSLMLEEASLVEGSFADSGSSKSLELWVLEDLEKHEWSKHIHVLPPLWRNVVGKTKLYFVGVIGTYEIVLSPHYPYDHFSIFYYNIKRNTIVRVEIQGMEAFKERSRFHTFINHFENLKLMQAF